MHGSGGNGLEFSTKFHPLGEILLKKHGVRIQIISITAPFPKGRGHAWWTMKPGARSFNATEYEGFHESVNLVLEAMEELDDDDNIDLVVAHSQGAILISAMLGLNCIGSDKHPPRGYILNGVAWPNPYGEKLLSAKLSEKIKILFVMGEDDSINPIESAEKVQHSLKRAGCKIDMHKHHGGHSFPVDDSISMEVITKWIIE